MVREIQLEDLYSRNRYPKHCGERMDPSPGDGIWECLKCEKWIDFPHGLPKEVEGRDLERVTGLVYNQRVN